MGTRAASAARKVREQRCLGVLPPIIVKDELAAGLLVEAGQLPDLAETLHAVTMKRKFPNPRLRLLLQSGTL